MPEQCPLRVGSRHQSPYPTNKQPRQGGAALVHGGRRLAGAAVEPRRQHLAQRVEARAFTGDLQEGVALQRVGHQVAAQGHLGILHAFAQAHQALRSRAQGVQRGQVPVQAGDLEVARHDAWVLAQHVHRLATERFGLVAHLGELAALVRRQCDQRRQMTL
ncbi:hypothetical protein ASD78_17820 [Lysobacter sp. Root667]|uniref:hypothetical protein n=1 Tax=Lysobacter sp. Root667 TaxID=1736581 RepID=UPI0006FBB105|nr:hypothetical protein [Lysobacter sp. Root667]KRA70693.1 hypothetical protein ASD78_17820 [Lysobacter sp. Root667]